MSHFYFSCPAIPWVSLHQVLERCLRLAFQIYLFHLQDVAVQKSIHRSSEIQVLLADSLLKVSPNFHDVFKLSQAFEHLLPRQQFSSVFTEVISWLTFRLSSVMLPHRLLDEYCFSFCCLPMIFYQLEFRKFSSSPLNCAWQN